MTEDQMREAWATTILELKSRGLALLMQIAIDSICGVAEAGQLVDTWYQEMDELYGE